MYDNSPLAQEGLGMNPSWARGVFFYPSGRPSGYKMLSNPLSKSKSGGPKPPQRSGGGRPPDLDFEGGSGVASVKGVCCCGHCFADFYGYFLL